MKINSVKLEMLRQGPSHNQLLSPLTPYLALCGNREAETFHVSVEHAEAMQQIWSLRYQDSKRDAAIARHNTGVEVSRILSDVKGLLAELAAVSEGDKNLVHIRLVLSASELALLPFELADSPSGFPGQGKPLLLQTVTPVVLTREVRRSVVSTLRWPDRPRILIVVANPPKVGEVPAAAHVLAISKALEPWLVTKDREGLAEYVTVIQRATLAAVRDACSKTAFTHVHLLAHGFESMDSASRDMTYGLAFHAEGDPTGMDVVSGARLASALRCHVSGSAAGGLSNPTVVTIASCDSGNVGSVISSGGGSVAHALHEAGIPLVLASQFPLSQRGSVVMTEALYPRLLAGEDPRVVTHAVRQVLHTDCPDTHDWASLTVYAALPKDIDSKVRKARFDSASRVVDASITRLDEGERTNAGAEVGAANRRALEAAMKNLEALVRIEDGPLARRRTRGLLGNAKKRFAHQIYGGPLWPIGSASTPGQGELETEADVPIALGGGDAERQRRARAVLEEARDHYLEAFRINASEAWAAVQYIATWQALHPPDRGDDVPERLADFTRWWTTATVLAEDNLESDKPQVVSWGHGALVELAVLAQLLPEGHMARATARADAFEHMDCLLVTARSRMESYSVRRQLRRYVEWWWEDRPDLNKLPAELAARMADRGVPLTYKQG